MKEFIKSIIKKIPIDFTQNQRYDTQTKAIIAKVCEQDSNCVDVGCHKGEMLEIMLKHAPQGQHFCFEPLPDLYEKLPSKFPKNCRFFKIGLSDKKGEMSFNYVISNPSYSGFQRRRYDKEGEKDTQITVKTDLLDNIIPLDVMIRLIKIDVEGAEFEVLKGAVKTIQRCRPIIIFEHGEGGADCYGTKPEEVYDLLTETCGMTVSTMDNYLKNRPALSRDQFQKHFWEGIDYYYIAYKN